MSKFWEKDAVENANADKRAFRSKIYPNDDITSPTPTKIAHIVAEKKTKNENPDNEPIL